MRGKQTETRLSIRRSRSFWRRISIKDTIIRLRRIRPARRNAIVIAFIVIVAELIATFHYFIPETSYALGNADKLLSPVSPQMASRLKFDLKDQKYTFNDKQASTGTKAESLGVAASRQASVTAYSDPKKGVTANDPTTGAAFTMKPIFGLSTGKRDGNRLVYPLTNGNTGWAVYTMHAVGVKEDIVLTKSPGKTADFAYDLQLSEGQEARLEADGSVGIYGNDLLGGNVTTATDADAKLLEKARKNAPKDTRLFSIPAPVVVEQDEESLVQARFELDGSRLTVKASQLDRGQYPLSIDPSIYVVTAQQFMQGNNETNVDFNVSDKLIQKGKTTGARFDSWDAQAVNLPQPSWSGASAAAGGYLYQTGGTTFNGQTFTSQGNNTYVVPTGVTSMTFKAWGAGGGGGGGGDTSTGGSGGGGGYVQSTIAVTPGETLTIYIGGGGGGGAHNALGSRAGGGGGGGGHTSVYRGATPILIAGGGAGGGGGRNAVAGGGGGGGGCTSTAAACNGVAAGNGGLGGGATTSAGGSAGTGGNNSGVAGSSLAGGAGADGNGTTGGSDGSGATGGGASGANGGAPNQVVTRAGGGGGAAGYFGGGGGGASSSVNSAAGGGGGGGSNFTAGGSTSVTNQTGTSAGVPGSSTDGGRNGAGDGGAAGPADLNGSKGAGGALLITNGSGGTTTSASVAWALLNADTGAPEGTDPGSGTCSGFCSTTAYNLPAARRDHSMVAYNGFLYVIGGTDGSTRQSTIYVTKLGANGEPRRWHPTSTDEGTWAYWHTTTALSSTRSLAGAVAYNNRLYVVGGLTGAGNGTTTSTVEYADINPNGTLSSWTTGTALTGGAVQGHSLLTYNDRLYVVGGAGTYTGSLYSSVRHIKLASNGAPTGTWQTTTPLSTARASGGGQMATTSGGYMYISGGCGAYTTGYCSNILTDTQVASINTDGSIGVWNAVGNLSSQRTGANVVSWRNQIYHIGGCGSQNTTTGDCDSAILSTVSKGKVNQDGDASTVGESNPSGTGSCDGSATSTRCNLPGTANIGNMLAATVITNGYIYVIGGCNDAAADDCSTTSRNVAFSAISSTGIMSRPATCSTGTFQGGTWCVATNQLTAGVAATSAFVFGGRVYLVGGLTGTGNSNSVDRATINTDGSLTGWTRQTMTGLDNGDNNVNTRVDAVSYSFAYARANPSGAGTINGHMFIFGGCTTNNGGNGCSAYGQKVFKCSILNDGSIGINAAQRCTTTGQLQIGTMQQRDDGTLPGPSDDTTITATGTGLGLMSGTVYANYVYLIGGVSPGLLDQKTVKYAKINDSNNVVDADSGGVGGANSWTRSDQQLSNGRRRGSAFGYNGYLYAVGGFEAGGGGVLRDIEFIKVNVNDGSLSSDGFKESQVVINQRWGLSLAVSNSFAYVIGGCTSGDAPADCTARTEVIQTFQIYNNDSGSPSGYANSATNYGSNRLGASASVLNGRIYVAGGCTSTTDCTAATDTVTHAPIDVNGTLGTWTTSTTGNQATGSLPQVRTWGSLLNAGGTLYYIGGQDSTATNEQSTVYYQTPNPTTGAIGTWTTGTALPAARTKFGAGVWNNRIYIAGGLDGSAADVNTVYMGAQVNSGGNIASWTTTSGFNVNRFGASLVAYANNLYLLGGNDGTNYLSDVQYSKLDPDTGTAGAWSYSTSLPTPLSQSDAYAANGYIYIQGGRSAAAACDPITLVAPISANTPVVSGNNPTGVGEWYETNQRFTTARYGAASAYYEGKSYVIGGACGATLTYPATAASVQQTTLLSQPQVARYSIAIDTDSDVFPNYWLLNGIDNSVGARWQMKYRSMHDPDTLVNPAEDCGTSSTMPAMTTWGAETNFGNVTLGLPGVYTPKESGGGNINCARFYYFNVSVDSSQAFGYPDDVTRGPTITDLTLQFTADPSKRLMHGRTFTGGLQQPIDTPY